MCEKRCQSGFAMTGWALCHSAWRDTARWRMSATTFSQCRRSLPNQVKSERHFIIVNRFADSRFWSSFGFSFWVCPSDGESSSPALRLFLFFGDSPLISSTFRFFSAAPLTLAVDFSVDSRRGVASLLSTTGPLTTSPSMSSSSSDSASTMFALGSSSFSS